MHYHTLVKSLRIKAKARLYVALFYLSAIANGFSPSRRIDVYKSPINTDNMVGKSLPPLGSDVMAVMSIVSISCSPNACAQVVF
jgi:hypothetical protein